jgi:7-carboxy-7-deazaguanine synthase
MLSQRIDIVEVFQSIDGEVNAWGQGRNTVFIRLVGCNLRCTYCDALYARDPGNRITTLTVDELISQIVKNYPLMRSFTITGGEPFLQMEALEELCSGLWKTSRISIETNGSYTPTKRILKYCKSIVMDWKDEHPPIPAIMYLRSTDWIKFVVDQSTLPLISSHLDFIKRNKIQAHIAISPIHGKLPPEEIITYMNKIHFYDYHLNIQLHKLIHFR